MGAQHSQPTRPTAPAADVTQPCPTQSAQQPQPPTDSEPLQLPTDVFDYFLASVSDPELLSQLSRVSKRANATVTRCHKPIIVHLTHSQRADPQQAAEQLCSKAAETQCKRLRFVGDWQEIDVKAWMGERVAASLVEVGNVLSQAPAQVALQNITTLELKVRAGHVHGKGTNRAFLTQHGSVTFKSWSRALAYARLAPAGPSRSLATSGTGLARKVCAATYRTFLVCA